jgi:hypothetical protein
MSSRATSPYSNKGRAWEREVEEQHRAYEAARLAACIRNQPTRPPPGQTLEPGDPLAVGKPDWTVCARRQGIPVTFAVEVKDTVADRWRYRDLSKAQAERLDVLAEQGVECFLLVRTPGGTFLVEWGAVAEGWWTDHQGRRRGDVDLATVGQWVEGADWLGVAIGW